ncbi:MAG: helix-turn-helix domain-containing protein, partial [Candidatus Saccharimonas sp.]|nr:helix-turn-helix domain-containing protein [Planctomycetaceae bacterium]
MEEFFATDPLTEEFSELDVLTLEEAAIYLKIEFGDLRRMIKEQGLPGRKIGDEWRFLRGAIADWLRAPGGSPTPTAQPEKPARTEQPARAERPAFDDRRQREERPRRRFPDVEVNADEGYPPRSQPPRPRPQFRSQNQFGGGAETGGNQG